MSTAFKDALICNRTGFEVNSRHEISTQLLSLITSLENGTETRIGEKGACLSGGEKQRLALARLWFEHSDLVVLDESTSALDNLTESIVIKNVTEQVGNATVIAIAHRLASISGFDKIFVFRDGKIVGSGTFEELLASNGYFGELY
ncbi:MAG: ATP-binding cassette domain-containing protein [Lachnospiraceae bacterium]|nr:ATP-binding cassette domain-containing protein [Lachnospiraceae bacterium]